MENVYYLNILFPSAGQLDDDFIYYIGISPLFDKGVFEINQGFQHLRAFFIRQVYMVFGRSHKITSFCHYYMSEAVVAQFCEQTTTIPHT